MELDMRLGYCTKHGSTTECLRCTIEELREENSKLTVEVGQLKQGLWQTKDAEIASWKDAYINMRDFAVSKGLDIVCTGETT